MCPRASVCRSWTSLCQLLAYETRRNTAQAQTSTQGWRGCRLSALQSKKRDRLSFYLANDKFSVDGHTLHVPKLGDVNMTGELRFQGKIMSATISYRAGWWFVSIAVEVEHETPTHPGGTVGIDLGIKTLATLSEGTVVENQKHYHRGLGRIQGLSKGLSRKVEG